MNPIACAPYINIAHLFYVLMEELEMSDDVLFFFRVLVLDSYPASLSLLELLLPKICLVVVWQLMMMLWKDGDLGCCGSW